MLDNKTVLTGIKPTGTPHLGNLVGAIKPAVNLANQAKRSYLFIADLHALNSVRDSKIINANSYEITATFLAAGLDLNKTVLFRQSDIAEIYAFSTLLTNVTAKGLMNRAHAYKAAVDRNKEKGSDVDVGINMGLFNYPILMAADILLYNADIVPVGWDQKQHVEFARDISGSFNRIYNKEVLNFPEPFIEKAGNAIPGLDGRKMSKSYDNTIPVFAEPKHLKKLVMKIITDSKPPEQSKDPEQSTIYQIYENFASVDELEFMRSKFEQGGMGYGEAKNRLFEAMNRELAKPRAIYKELMAQPKQLEDILAAGAKVAGIVARNTLNKVTETMLGRSISFRDC